MPAELFANTPSTTVASGGTTAPASGTPETWTVASSAEFPAASTGVSQFHVGDPALTSEMIAVTNVSGTTWTVTRGAESTTPVAHTAGFTVQQVVTAGVLGTFAQAGLGDIGGSGTAPSVLSVHLSVPLPVTQGGTGLGSLSSFLVLAGGTASTSAAQQIPSGTSGFLLTSNGPGSLPSFQAFPTPVKTVTSTNTTLATDSVTLCNAGTASFTDNLPDATAVTAGVPYTFKKTDPTANEVTLLPSGTQTIDGASYYNLETGNSSVTLRSDGSNWWAF